MTEQAKETLHYGGQEHLMDARPLDTYFALMGIEHTTQSTSSALWRGYMGEWELVAGRLYLLQLEDTDGQDCMPRYFPGFEARVFAHWFDGQIRLAYGQEIEHSRLHYLRLREKEIILDLRRGRLIDERRYRISPEGKKTRLEEHQ